MANIKSAIKRNRQNEKRAAANKTVRSQMRTFTKKALETSSPEDLSAAIKHIDKAANKGVIHKNAASRKKSRLTKAVNAAK